jgi:glycerol-3-phosphate acyltransferase PlsY
MPLTLPEFLVLTAAYLIGSIPFGLLLSQLFKLDDPRTVGSNSIGATNVLRSGHYGAAVLTLLFDALKGAAAVSFALLTFPSLALWAGVFVIIGHIWPVWLGFRGGKGVATALGVLFMLSWPVAIVCLVTWFVVAVTTRYSSLAALVAAILSPLYSLVLGKEDLSVICLMIALMIVWAHRQNIRDLKAGKEGKIGEKYPPDSSQN